MARPIVTPRLIDCSCRQSGLLFAPSRFDGNTPFSERLPMYYRFLPLGVIGIAVTTTALVINAAGPANFKPDGMVTGSTLAGWHVLGDAEWKNQNGELVGTARAGGNGGWLVMDKSFQDVQLYASYRCTGACTSGVLVRGQKTADGGMSGVFVSLIEGDTAA
jgi:3-keto-disaccharide hydrolase